MSYLWSHCLMWNNLISHGLGQRKCFYFSTNSTFPLGIWFHLAPWKEFYSGAVTFNSTYHHVKNEQKTLNQFRYVLACVAAGPDYPKRSVGGLYTRENWLMGTSLNGQAGEEAFQVLEREIIRSSFLTVSTDSKNQHAMLSSAAAKHG